MIRLLKNPLTIWFNWYIQSMILSIKNRHKNLKIGYLTRISNSNFGLYNTFYNNNLISNSNFGNFVYVGNETKINNTTIGNFCSIGSNIQIGISKHPINFISTFPSFYSTGNQCQKTFVDKNYYEETGEVNIGNDVWIGSNVIIMSDITIGDGAVIAAGAIVTKDVDSYSVVGGVPAILIKKRFDENQINKLMNFKWWNKNEEWLKKNVHLFSEPSLFFSKI